MPAPEHGIAIETLPARRIAAIRFPGAPDDAMLAAREAELRGWLDANGHRAAGAAEHAYYDAPFIPAPLRRNELWLPLA
ncbi:hypothetical protein FBR43_11380 [Sphingomonas baiyangensis]|uniref:SOUL heme-binding protein n=1 Tax=Sphingomonas baiyangensis TaxID=2572576 RepID=A0A4U1L335_9SPHN|nr:hypothetical protein FBR43_11380 [Sphingomonas baiyangensis]